MTFTPFCFRPFASSAINSSVPPYFLGGTGIKGGETNAIFMELLIKMQVSGVMLETTGSLLREFSLPFGEQFPQPAQIPARESRLYAPPAPARVLSGLSASTPANQLRLYIAGHLRCPQAPEFLGRG